MPPKSPTPSIIAGSSLPATLLQIQAVTGTSQLEYVQSPERLASLAATGLLDSPPEEVFDRLTRLACQLMRAPIALLSLVDANRQFFKSSQGLPEPWLSLRESPLTYSFCQHAVATRAPLIVSNAITHPIARLSLGVTEMGIRAYAGVPIIAADGHALGTLCVFDHQAREWSSTALQGLTDLAALATAEVDRRTARRRASGPSPAVRWHFRHLLDTIPLMIWSVDDRGHMDYVNAQWLEFRGRSAEEEAGQGWSAGVHPDDRDGLVAAAATAMNEGQPLVRFFRLQRADGEYRQIHDRGVPHYGPDGDFLGYVGFAEDVTDRTLENERSERANRVEAVRQLASGMAHNFNNQTTAILSMLDLALSDTSLVPGTRGDLELAQKAAERIGRLIRQLLEFSRLEVVRRRLVNVNELLMGLESIFWNVLGERSRLTLQLEPTLVPALADRDQMEQMLVSLVFRARDTMATGGALIISTAHRRVEPAVARARPGLRASDYVVIALKDSGPGLTPVELQYVFDPFPQGAMTAEHPGLTLPAVYGMMKQCDGYIDVESDILLGTTITLYFEAAQSPPA